MTDDGITPGYVGAAFWRWFWVGAGALALIAGVTYAGHAFGWWLSAQNATHQAENTQNGYANQTTLREQITSQLAEVDTLTTQIANAKGDQSLITALKPQRMAVAGIVCGDAAEISGTPLPAQQAQWVSVNCLNGTVSPQSTYYQAGQP
jgi:hypothetical protein